MPPYEQEAFYRRLKNSRILIRDCFQRILGIQVIVRIYFCREPEADLLIRNKNISYQALYTLYDLVWESEFKNVLNVGRIWLAFMQGSKPFGKPLRNKRTHDRISPGDIIGVGHDHYVVSDIGAIRVRMVN